MNRRADLNVMVLVIGILAVCFMALMSFYLNSVSMRTRAFDGLDAIHDINLKIEKGEAKTAGSDAILGEYAQEEKIIKYYVRRWKDNVLYFRIKRALSK